MASNYDRWKLEGPEGRNIMDHPTQARTEHGNRLVMGEYDGNAWAHVEVVMFGTLWMLEPENQNTGEVNYAWECATDALDQQRRYDQHDVDGGVYGR